MLVQHKVTFSDKHTILRAKRFLERVHAKGWHVKFLERNSFLISKNISQKVEFLDATNVVSLEQKRLNRKIQPLEN